MFKATSHPYLVPHDRPFKITECLTRPPDGQVNRKEQKKQLTRLVGKIDLLQRKLYAENKWALLLVFQAMDAAGKDSTIRAILRGINPAGCQVYSFKQPSREELEHDFLWRTSKRLPERGKIGVFNRSYYEETLVVRVHPEYLQSQHLPSSPDLDSLWPQRFESINQHERHLAENGTVILKFWLNVSKDEQKQRFLSRLEEPEKHWKFSAADIDERGYWDSYMQAYEATLHATSKPWAPWYAIPADDKPYMRKTVADIVYTTLKALKPEYPVVVEDEKDRFSLMREQLLREK